MRQRESPLRPAGDETLAMFLRRAQEERKIRNEALAKRLVELDPSKKESSWVRQVKAWRSGVPPHVNEENARCLEVALSADFQAFLFDPADHSWRDVLLELRSGLVALDERVAALEKHLSEQ